MNAKQDYIAVFDSGVGGISVLRHLIRHLPGERFLYYGDSANAPYGSRTTEEVRQLTLAAAEKLTTEYPIKALVIACNTATAAAVIQVRQTYPDLIVIGIEPALKVAADNFPGGRIGVMATEVTLREEKFDILLHRFDEECTITKIPAPGLVQLIEAGKVDTERPRPCCGRFWGITSASWMPWCWAVPTIPLRQRPFPGFWKTEPSCWKAATAPQEKPAGVFLKPVFWKKAKARSASSTAPRTKL